MYSNIKHWVFDLDGTLYGPHNGFMGTLKACFVNFLRDDYGMSQGEALLATEMFAGHSKQSVKLPDIESAKWEAYFQEHLDHAVLKRCEDSIVLIEELLGNKVVFTNSNRKLAQLTLGELGLHALFDTVNTVCCRDGIGKHDVKSFHHMLDHAKIDDPTEAVLVEDSVHNLEHAKSLGMTTILVYGNTDAPHVDYCYPTLLEFLKAAQMPKLA